MSEIKIQVLSIQSQISTQKTLIKELTEKRREITEQIDSDLELANELLGILQSKLPNQNQVVADKQEIIFEIVEKQSSNQSPTVNQKRSIIKPQVADENVLIILKSSKQGITIPEITRLINQRGIKISKNGVEASLERFMNRNLAKIINPEQKIYKKYVWIGE